MRSHFTKNFKAYYIKMRFVAVIKSVKHNKF